MTDKTVIAIFLVVLMLLSGIGIAVTGTNQSNNDLSNNIRTSVSNTPSKDAHTVFVESNVVNQTCTIDMNDKNLTYIYGEVNGGGVGVNGEYQPPLSTGIAKNGYANTTSGTLGAQISGVTTSNHANVSSSPTHATSMAGIAFNDNGYSSPILTFGHNDNPNATATFTNNYTYAFDNFTLSSNACVIFMAMASSQYYVTIQGIPGLIVDNNTSRTSTTILPIFIAHAYLSAGSYHAEEISNASTFGQTYSNMADIIGAFIFNAKQSNEYRVAFTESGLPSGTSWSVTLNGTTASSASSTIACFVPNGTYSYSIGTVSDYTSSISRSSITVDGRSVNVPITFTAVPISEYNVSFTESGLLTGTSWYVTLNGTTLYSTGSTLSFTEPNGTYSFTVGPVSDYTFTPSSGSITVNGDNVQSTITATATHISTEKSPVWAFTGAYMNYTVATTYYNFTIISVNSAAAMIEYRESTETDIFYTNVSWNNYFLALNTTDISMLNQGLMPAQIKGNSSFDDANSVDANISYKTSLGNVLADRLIGTNVSLYFDSYSGILVGEVFNNRNGNTPANVNLTSTNVPIHSSSSKVTSSKPFGLSSIELYGIIGAVVAAVAIAGAFFIRKRKK